MKYNIITEKNSLYESEGGDCLASIKEVAQKAGVGVGTVSRVLNSTGYVSDETRIKVETAMKELNYIPNELARNLLSKKSGIVAIIIPKISHPFFAEVVLYAEAELMKKGYKTMICSTYSKRNYEKEYINMLNRHIVLVFTFQILNI